jgi:hypothetical protein
MTQNIYDNPDFFQGYSRMDRSLHGLEGAAESAKDGSVWFAALNGLNRQNPSLLLNTEYPCHRD